MPRLQVAASCDASFARTGLGTGGDAVVTLSHACVKICLISAIVALTLTLDIRVKKQYAIAALIVGAFLSSIVSAELLPSLPPEEFASTSRLLEQIEMAITVLFTLELAMNVFANFLLPFISSAWNIFDLLVVVLCW